jgi:hypothetical protein
MSQPQPQFATVTAFRQALASALLRVARTEMVNRTAAGELMYSLDLPRPVAASAGEEDYTLPPIPEDIRIAGHLRTDFTPGKLAELDHRAVYDLRSLTYRRLRDQIGYDLSEEAIIAVCAELGLPVPVITTHVQVSVLGFASTIRFSIEGEIDVEDKDQITDRFDSLVHDPAGDAVRALYPHAQGLAPRVTIRTEAVRSWPQFPSYAPLA